VVQNKKAGKINGFAGFGAFLMYTLVTPSGFKPYFQNLYPA
jgi:hypothetical protein